MTHTCRLCGTPVDCTDAVDARDIAALLLAHLALWCTDGGQAVNNPARKGRSNREAHVEAR